jgi:hypothetical protein
VLTIIPPKGKVYHITIPQADITANIEDEIFIAIKTPANSNAAEKKITGSERPETEEEEDDEKTDTGTGKSVKSKPKRKPAPKKAAKKAPVKKAPAKKEAPKKSSQLSIDDQPKQRKSRAKQAVDPDPAVEEAVKTDDVIEATTVAQMSEEEKEAQYKKEQFDGCMEHGRKMIAEKDFDKAVDQFSAALDFISDSEEAKNELELAIKKRDAFNLINS